MFKKILWSKFAFWSLFFLLVQQLIVASSTFWIAHLSEAVVTGKNFTFYLGLLVTSLFIVYIPGIVSSYNLEKAKSQAIYKYTLEFAEKYKCIPTKITEKEFQHDKEPWLTSESSKTIEETYSVAYDSVSTGLNTTLNVAALCLVIDPRILVGYSISFIILPLASSYFKNKLSEVALTLQNDRKFMSQALLSGWDNIIIGNLYNFSIWWKHFKARWEDYNNSSARAVLLTQISSTGAMIFSLIPIAGIFIWLFATASNTAKLAALVATLPRQIQIIQHVQILSAYIMHWHGTYAKVKTLIGTLISPKEDKIKFLTRIKENQIVFLVNKNQMNFLSFEQFLETLLSMKTGRITIQGRNGTGKTTLINLLKEELKNKAYYLPTNSRLMFENSIEGSYSTGQKVKSCLEELAQHFFQDGGNPQKNNLSNSILLLDEWDANLDVKNIEKISLMLDDFSKRCCIVEISHRKENNENSQEEVKRNELEILY